MRIDDTTSSTFSVPQTAAAKPTQRDEFLRLFVAQLQNQNPLEPQSGAEFVAQLAQFASVEQSAEANQRLAAIQAEQASMSSAALAGFVGKTATVSASSIEIKAAGGAPALAIDVDGAAQSAKLVIRDSGGNEVRTIELGAVGEGIHQVPWDGTDRQGVPLGAGSYSITVEATAADGSAIDARPQLVGTIDAIEFESGVPMMRIGGVVVSPASVLAIS
jgi:flagellar basal-body rod modification protein FlgD